MKNLVGDVYNAIADPTRRILMLAYVTELFLHEITVRLQIGCKHLAILKDANFVST